MTPVHSHMHGPQHGWAAMLPAYRGAIFDTLARCASGIVDHHCG